MTDRGPDQDTMPVGGRERKGDATYRDASYLVTDEEDEEEVQDLGFIVENHDDRRAVPLDNFQRVEELDTDEPLGTDPSGPIPRKRRLERRGVPPESFATDYNVTHARAAAQEEDFVETSMLATDPDAEAGVQDFTDETLRGADGNLLVTGILGRVPGVTDGLGTSVPQDAGRGSFRISDNPLMRPADAPISGDVLSDAAIGTRDVDEMGSERDLDRLADIGAREIEREESADPGRKPSRRRKGQ
jgi:hypothetical protein